MVYKPNNKENGFQSTAVEQSIQQQGQHTTMTYSEISALLRALHECLKGGHMMHHVCCGVLLCIVMYEVCVIVMSVMCVM